MVRNSALAACLLLGISLCVAAQAGGTAYPVYRPPAAPLVDGDVAGDPAWAMIPAVTGFYKLGGGYADAKQTVLQVCWDDQALYVAMTCEEPDAAKLNPQVRTGGPTWTEDSVEIFLQPKAGGQVYQMGVTAGGAVGSGEGAPDVTKVTAAATIGADFYSIELKVPYDVISATAVAGDKWRGGFCRNIFTTDSGGDKFTTWTPLLSRFLEPENFATLTLMGETPTAEQARATGEQLNRDYRAELLTRLREASREGAAYKDAIAQAADSEKFAAEAKRIQAEWDRIEELNRAADQADTRAIRASLQDVDQLIQDSYTLKYTYLIDQLLSEMQ